MSKRRNRGISMRARVAVAAAVVVAGGAGAVVAFAGHSNATNAASASFDSQTTKMMSMTQSMSSAMNGWNSNPNKSIITISKQQPMGSFEQTSWHKKTLAEQRGTVVAAVGKELVVESGNKKVELWHWNGNTHVVNVAGNRTATTDVTGSASNWLSSWHMRKTNKIAKGDMVFIFGEKVHGELEAQLVLFAAPMTTTATATPTPTTTATSMATSTATATRTATSTTMTTATATPSTSTSTGTTINGMPATTGHHS